MNSLGFFTYTFPITTHIFVTFGLGLGIWLGVIILGFYSFRGMFLSSFNPSGAVDTNCSGDELAANLTAVHILMAILGGFGCKLLFFIYGAFPLFPILIVLFMTILEIGVLVIQADVFCLLSTIYLKDSVILH